ncbi:MAG: protein-glutamate O-methyltransferase CheR, partial [Proteobacteria bacterium]|nr:protein-glutamate O-methyltransferase CheR [Pseudomonadota bacterium]
MLKISPDELKLVAQYIHDISGIYLEQSKSYLFETRLGSIATEHGCNTYKELYQKAKTEPSKIIERKIIDAISTNETLFFRDKGPFELLQHKLLPELIDARTPGSPALKTNL